MKILAAIGGFIVKIIVGSFVWLIVALVGSFPLGLLILKIFDVLIENDLTLYEEIDNQVNLLYVLFAVTCFVGIVLARVVAVAIKVMAEKKLPLKTEKI